MKAITNKIFSLILSTSMLASLLPVSALAAGFTDVPQGTYYEDAVDWAVENDITSGTSGTEFSPDETCTRAQAVTFLWRANGQPDAAGNTPFTDVATSSYYNDAVQWAVANGITSGTSPNTFEPDAPVTRAQVMTFLYRNADSPSTRDSASFADVPTDAYYRDAVRWAVTQGITAGTSATAFSPDESCTRAQIVTFLYRSSDDSPEQPVEEMPEEPVLPEKPLQPEEPVQPEQELTDKEIQQLLSDPDIAGATAALINGFRKMEKHIDLSPYRIETSAAKNLALEVSDFYNGNPYYLSTVSSIGAVGKQAEAIHVNYQYTPEEAAEKREQDAKEQAAVDSAIASCVTDGMSDYEIAKALHDYLALNCEYDKRYYSGSMPYVSYTAYGALVNRTAVCQGYALAYQELLAQCGIESEYVSGLGNGGRHGWNIIRIDGEWYHVDVTWDDPTPDREGYVRYDYFLKSDRAMSRDHSNWKASHTCTSTKYDNVTILSPKDEQEAIEKAEEQAREEAVTAEILTYCKQAMTEFPYATEEALRTAETLTADDWRSYIYFPDGEYTREELDTARKKLYAVLEEGYPDYELNRFAQAPDGRWYFEILRNDVVHEMERREAQVQEELSSRAAKVELLLQDALKNAQMQHYEYQVTGYTDEEIKLACSDMNQSGYAFDGYTSADYRLSAQSGGRVTIVNRKWAEQETERQTEIIRSAIRIGQTEVRLDGQQEDGEISEYYYPSLAADRVGKEGYSFDNLTAGADYIIAKTFINNGQYVVQISYPASEQSSEAGSSADL